MRTPLLCCLFALAFVVTALAEDKKLEPTPLSVNTDADEDEPHRAGLTLYFGVTVKGKERVKLASRKSANSAYGKPEDIDDYVTAKGDIRGVTTLGGSYPQYLYFAAKDKESKNYDIYVAVKQGAGKAWAAPTPVQVIATAEDEAHPWLTSDGKSLYFSRRTKDGWKVYVSTRKTGTGAGGWGEPKEAGLAEGYHHATLTPDGKTMYLQGPLEKDRSGLFVSTLAKGSWSKPTALAALNDADAKRGDRSPSLSRDGRTLYFASDRAGGKGGLDLYAIETGKLTAKKKK